MIKVKNLNKTFLYKGQRHTVLENLNFTIEDGESVALLGRNGAGKSTLLNILGGTDQADSGEIFKNCTISWPVGLVGGFQGSLSARENIVFVSKIFCGNKKYLINEKVNKVKDFAEIGEYFDRPFKTYSSGMKSRITFGLSMVFPFDVYLIDEVTSAGDANFRIRCRDAIAELRKRSEFIMVDHNLWGLSFHCDKAFILEKGKIQIYNDVEEGIEAHKKMLMG